MWLKKSLGIAILGLSLAGCEGLPLAPGESKDDESADELAEGINEDGEIVDEAVAFEGSVVISGTIGTVGAALTEGLNVTDLKFTWVTFEAEPRAGEVELDENGFFETEVPRNIQFGAFVRNKNTDEVVATIVVEAIDDSGFGDGPVEEGSLALDKALDFGNLVISEDGKIKISKEVIKESLATLADALLLDLDSIHEREYVMTCIPTGNAERDAACEEWVKDGSEDSGENTVFFRVIKGEAEGKMLRALGIWKDKAAFEACGGIDMPSDMRKFVELEGVTFSQLSDGDFTPGGDCRVRMDDHDGDKDGDHDDEKYPDEMKSEEGMQLQDALDKPEGDGEPKDGEMPQGEDDKKDQGPDGMPDDGKMPDGEGGGKKEDGPHGPTDMLEDYFALEKLRKVGGGWAMQIRHEGKEEFQGPDGQKVTCHYGFAMDIVMSGNGDEIVGAFKETEFMKGCGDEDKFKSEARNIKFTAK